MIDVKNLQKHFGANHVLRGIDQHIAKGEKVVIIGASGSGKSTFLRCLNLLEQPTGGTILFDDVDITDPKCDINKLR
ncbi:MAG: amino acid ABC transporter ATP-binding protein, partial [Butyricicoccus sp.]|nr:amino acid ABC transporter ATP-binding protein [Butyricicoccus sp.]